MAGKHMESRKRIKLSTVLVIAAALALVTAIGGTMAWLTTHSDGLTNTFTPAKIEGEVKETFNSPFNTKNNVYIQNTSDAPVYVRVALVPTWVNAAHEPMAEPCSLDDLDITWGDNKETDWFVKDGYYYYKTPVSADGETSVLIQSATVKADKTPAGCTMNLQVLLQMIQAEPASAVTQAWGVTVNADGTISK